MSDKTVLLGTDPAGITWRLVVHDDHTASLTQNGSAPTGGPYSQKSLMFLWQRLMESAEVGDVRQMEAFR